MYPGEYHSCALVLFLGRLLTDRGSGIAVHLWSGRMKWIGKIPPGQILISLFPPLQPGVAVQPLTADNHPAAGLQPCVGCKPRLIITCHTDFHL
jgi:hypothetical protein